MYHIASRMLQLNFNFILTDNIYQTVKLLASAESRYELSIFFYIDIFVTIISIFWNDFFWNFYSFVFFKNIFFCFICLISQYLYQIAENHHHFSEKSISSIQNSITRDRKITLRCSSSSLDTKNSLSFLTYKKGNFFSYWRQKSNKSISQSILIISYSMYVLNSVLTQYFKCR